MNTQNCINLVKIDCEPDLVQDRNRVSSPIAKHFLDKVAHIDARPSHAVLVSSQNPSGSKKIIGVKSAAVVA